MNKQETIADIIAEKRREAKEIRDNVKGDYWDRKESTEIAEVIEDEADRLEAAHKREAQSIERIVRDAIIDYQEMYVHAPNDEAERDLIDRANRGNAWLASHGYELEKTIWDKEEATEYLRDKLPNPDPDWKDICAKCKDGDIEPKHCEYYGEPNGCNSPTYGEHPPTPNAAAMYSCLLRILAEMTDLGGMEVGRKAHFSPDAIADEISQALAAPPRNCDAYDAKTAEKEFVRQTGSKSIRSKSVRWLYAPATEQEGGNDGNE